MSYLGDIKVDATLTHWWNTNDADGASITRATNGTIKVDRDDGTDCTAGVITDTEDDPDTGIHRIVIDTSGHAACIAAHDYTVWVDGAVIDGETVNAALCTFSIENRFMRGTDSANTTKTGYSLTNFTDANATNLNSACTNYSVTRGLSGTALPAVVAGAASGIPLKDASNFLDVANMPAVAAGAAGGLFIAETNAETTVTTAINANLIGNITGDLSGSVGSLTALANDAITAASINTGAFTSDAYAANALAAGTFAASSLDGKGDWNTVVPATKAQMDTAHALLATPAQVATNVNAQVLDVLNVDTFSLPGQEAPPLTPTLVGALTLLYKSYRNRENQTATLYQLFADNETTVDAKATISDDGTTFIKQEVVSGP